MAEDNPETQKAIVTGLISPVTPIGGGNVCCGHPATSGRESAAGNAAASCGMFVKDFSSLRSQGHLFPDVIPSVARNLQSGIRREAVTSEKRSLVAALRRDDRGTSASSE
jgi:hypothetical protein